MSKKSKVIGLSVGVGVIAGLFMVGKNEKVQSKVAELKENEKVKSVIDKVDKVKENEQVKKALDKSKEVSDKVVTKSKEVSEIVVTKSKELGEKGKDFAVGKKVVPVSEVVEEDIEPEENK